MGITRLVALLFLGLINLNAYADDTYQVKVNLSAIKNTEGNIFVEIYSDASTFRNSAKALKVIKISPVVGNLSVIFSGLDAGTYAVLVYHDEDGNNQMNKRFGMIPTEGYGLSNNPKVIGPPAFKDSAFKVDQDLEINVQLNY